VYVWNGSSYTNWNTGSASAARWIAPHQAFFLRAISTASGNFTFTNAMRTSTPGTPISTLKSATIGNNVILSVSGEGRTNQTEIVLNPSATSGFDGDFDAYYLSALANVPALYSQDNNGVKYGLNQFPSSSGQTVDLGFSYYQNNKTFTISLDQNLASAISFITLEDTYAQTLTNLKSSDYTFTSNAAASAQRFKLHFSQSSIGVAEMENGTDLKVWVSGNELRFDENTSLDGATINVYNTGGQLLLSGTTANPIFVNQTGVYVININTKMGQTHNVKVVKL
jgi:hypothetical protein